MCGIVRQPQCRVRSVRRNPRLYAPRETALQPEQGELVPHSAAVADRTAVRADDPVTGNENAEGGWRPPRRRPPVPTSGQSRAPPQALRQSPRSLRSVHRESVASGRSPPAGMRSARQCGRAGADPECRRKNSSPASARLAQESESGGGSVPCGAAFSHRTSRQTEHPSAPLRPWRAADRQTRPVCGNAVLRS